MSPDVTNIAKLSDGGSSEHQVQHRVDLFNKWNILPGSKVLEIGCGQGDFTLVAAYMVGDQGHVTAIDPAPLDYGAPMTLGEAQEKLKQTSIGDRMTFYESNLQQFLDSSASEQVYDYAMFVHSVWYLPSADVLQQMLAALRGRAKHLLIAEYSLDIRGNIAALPHLLAAISQAEFNSRGNTLNLDDNIQSIISQQMICALAQKEGWVLQKEDIVESPEGQEDARWEVHRVLSEGYSLRSESSGDSGRQDFAKALIDAVSQSTRVIGPNPKLRTLSTWLGSWV
ncbi:hypothetical protein N7517_000128 [Penicillium concentricum]|uniref:Methyltransferase domain-containing protein n=1 Tax=Penicillium concentricum TaxID=293559 RepID=A0A9W9SPQ3_9EURO|nr:uncharacterized protein N7517_000128 [Penicillium concentricum]KAJ5382217.1 hypothetical protein N7517_000128 [Penicillium concentricum]